MIKNALYSCYESYKNIMDHNSNPLRNIPDPMARFWIMTVLAWLWSIAFGLSLGSIIVTGLSMIAHLAVLLMIFITVCVFYDAEKNNYSWLVRLKAERNGESMRLEL